MMLIDARLSLVLFALAALPSQAQMGLEKTPIERKTPGGHNETTAKPKPWPEYNKGVLWKRTLEEAQAESKSSGKPIMIFQLVGDMDMEGC